MSIFLSIDGVTIYINVQVVHNLFKLSFFVIE